MKELIDTIERVRERIKKYENQLKQNEMLTRYVLVDPILRALGWDTENPDQVIPEPITETGRPDYALMHNCDILIMVEVKSLKSNLEKARDDGFKYCWKNKVPFYIITDGDIWELYDLREMGGKEIFRVRLSTDSPGDIARHLLAIWYPAMPVLKPAPKSVVDTHRYTEEHKQMSSPGQLLSLEKLSNEMKSKQEPPKYIQFPDEEPKEINSWRNLLVEVAKWALPKLQEENKLPLGRLIHKGKMRRYRYEKLDGGWKVSTNFNSKNCVRNAIRILKEAGISADEVFVINKDKIKK
jgi:hypothetical protein